MKSLLFVVLFLYALIPTNVSSSRCYRADNPNASPQLVDCNWSDHLIERDLTLNQESGTVPQEMFKVVLDCRPDNVTLCENVKRAFDKASKVISSTLKLNSQIVVNATFYDFCQGFTPETCDPKVRIRLGQAGPVAYYSLEDDDGFERLYPQALVKQFQFPNHPTFHEFDIFAEFNSGYSYWFEGQGPIKRTESDFFYVMLHELLHGLGFLSCWNDFRGGRRLFPEIQPVNEMLPDGNQTATEFVFDKYMIFLSDGSPVSNVTKHLHDYLTITGSTLGPSEFAMLENMYKLATIPNSFGILPRNSTNLVSDAIILDTSIDTYIQGTSLTHVDRATYNNTSDFLMIYIILPGVTTEQLIEVGGNYSGGVIGPKHKLILETLGYATEENPNPYRPKSFDETSFSMNLKVSYNLKLNLYILVIITLYFTIL